MGSKKRTRKKVMLIDRKRSAALRRGRALDGRTRDAKYLRVTYSSMCADLGGEEELSVQQRLLVQQAAWQSAQLLNMQADLLAGRSYDGQSYSATLNSLLGILRTLGVERKAKRAGGLLERLKAETGGTAAK